MELIKSNEKPRESYVVFYNKEDAYTSSAGFDTKRAGIQTTKPAALWNVTAIGIQVFDDGFTRYDQTRAKIDHLFTGGQAKKIFIAEFDQPGGAGSPTLYQPAAEYVALLTGEYQIRCDGMRRSFVHSRNMRRHGSCPAGKMPDSRSPMMSVN